MVGGRTRSEAFLGLLDRAVRLTSRAVLWFVFVSGSVIAVIWLLINLTLLRPFVADTEISERQLTIRLTFEYIDDLTDSGRYLTVVERHGRLTQKKMCGWDWAHRGRTGVYLAGEHDLAVLGVDDCDYLIVAETMTILHATRVPSDDWVYLGAFDWVGRTGGGRRFLRFIPAAEQGECVIDSETDTRAPRPSARYQSCPSLPAETGRY